MMPQPGGGRRAKSKRVGGWSAALLALAAACSSPVVVSSVDGGFVPPPVRGEAQLAASAAPSSSVPLPSAVFREEDFVEGERSRDPFRSFASLFSDEGKTRVRSQRQVLLDQYAIDDLKLIALVTRADVPRAMLVDPTGRGWVVTQGEFIGRAEWVHGGGAGAVDYELNWKVDRIRDGDLVLVREDPAHADLAPATRVIALRSGEAAGAVPTR